MLIAYQEWILLLTLLVALSVSVGYLLALRRAIQQLPRLTTPPQPHLKRSLHIPPISEGSRPEISVIIPAYNEVENIEDCVRSVLFSHPVEGRSLELWVIDDQSTDATWKLLQTLQHQLADPRLKLLSGAPRPPHERWTGKNWACQQGAQQAQGEWLLFIDADVRLKGGAIAAVVSTASERDLDLLTCIPEIVSVSWVEWLVQPLMFTNVLVAFNSAVVKDPKSPVTYALGPFLLFRAATYRAIGEHAGIAGQIAEDVAFARKIKHNGYRLQHILAPSVAALRMYRTWTTLWEGWTKVLYVGANSKLLPMVALVLVMLCVYTLPWLGLGAALGWLLVARTGIGILTLMLALLGVLLQYWVRSLSSPALGTTTRYWWLQGLGGALIGVLAIASVIKAKTGWGWTWRGRSLRSS